RANGGPIRDGRGMKFAVLAESLCTCICMCNWDMRTTVVMKAVHRSDLRALASHRGHKEFSAVLGEAIQSFLQGEAERERRRKTLLSLAGSISKKDREELLRETRELRESWR